MSQGTTAENTYQSNEILWGNSSGMRVSKNIKTMKMTKAKLVSKETSLRFMILDVMKCSGRKTLPRNVGHSTLPDFMYCIDSNIARSLESQI